MVSFRHSVSGRSWNTCEYITYPWKSSFLPSREKQKHVVGNGNFHLMYHWSKQKIWCWKPISLENNGNNYHWSWKWCTGWYMSMPIGWGKNITPPTSISCSDYLGVASGKWNHQDLCAHNWLWTLYTFKPLLSAYVSCGNRGCSKLSNSSQSQLAQSQKPSNNNFCKHEHGWRNQKLHASTPNMIGHVAASLDFKFEPPSRRALGSKSAYLASWHGWYLLSWLWSSMGHAWFRQWKPRSPENLHPNAPCTIAHIYQHLYLQRKHVT